MSPLTTLVSRSTPRDTRPPAAATSRWWQLLWSRRDGRLQNIRQFMMVQLATVQDEPARGQLAHSISSAACPQDLWALREALRVVLVQTHGELLARQRMTDVSFMFAGLLHEREHARSADLPDGQGWSSAAAARALGQDEGAARMNH